ncbi:MAG: citrate/2-methylcitrate synthase [Paenacidovorax caeni]
MTPHYRGYDILDIAEVCEFEEIAHLLVHGKLPTRAELKAYKAVARPARPARQREGRAGATARCQPPDGCDAHGQAGLARRCRERRLQLPGARRHCRPPDGQLRSMLLPGTTSALGRRIEVETDDDSIGGHFLHPLHGAPPSEGWVRAMHTSLNLYAEHEFNASTFTARHRRHGQRHVFEHLGALLARCAAPSTAVPTRWRLKFKSATTTPTRPRPTSAAAWRPRRW